jgi:hypothetical protein
MNWKERLTESQNASVKGYENERSAAVMAWLNGKISMTEARAIVARCNHEIARIAEGAA